MLQILQKMEHTTIKFLPENFKVYVYKTREVFNGVKQFCNDLHYVLSTRSGVEEELVATQKKKELMLR